MTIARIEAAHRPNNNQLIEATEEALLEAARTRSFPLSGDRRVGERHAAELVGIRRKQLRHAQLEGRGPASYRLPPDGALSFRLHDLAVWIEEKRENAQD